MRQQLSLEQRLFMSKTNSMSEVMKFRYPLIYENGYYVINPVFGFCYFAYR